MFIICKVVAGGGRTLIHDTIKEVSEEECFGAFYMANFHDSNHCLKEIYLSDDSSGKNAVLTEQSHPMRVALTFGKTFVKFVVLVEDPGEPINEVPVMNVANVLMESSRRLAQESRKNNSPQLPHVISPESKKSYNRKDELFNAIVEMLKEKEIFFPNASVSKINSLPSARHLLLCHHFFCFSGLQ